MRTCRWLFILFQLAWLNVVIPGHTRGAITLPGATPSCQVGEASCCDTRESAPGKKSPTQDEKKRCAICYFAAGLTIPPVVTFDHAVLGRVTLLPLPPPIRASYERFPLPYDALAPPLG